MVWFYLASFSEGAQRQAVHRAAFSVPIVYYEMLTMHLLILPNGMSSSPFVVESQSTKGSLKDGCLPGALVSYNHELPKHEGLSEHQKLSDGNAISERILRSSRLLESSPHNVRGWLVTLGICDLSLKKISPRERRALQPQQGLQWPENGFDNAYGVEPAVGLPKARTYSLSCLWDCFGGLRTLP